MENSDYSDGAAAMMGLWREQEGFTEDGNFLILSGGDNWTGPAISTWYQGESMVEVMNGMDYVASAIGNHEFDFKIDGLKQRMIQADFPYLSANIREKASGEIPEYITPYIIKEMAGMRVGIVGLTTTSAAWTTFPDNVAHLDFISYETALTQIVPEVNEQDVDLLIVIGHICHQELLALVPTAKMLGIDIMTGGHCNELFGETIEGIVLIEGGAYMASYARVEIILDEDTNDILNISPSVHLNENGTEDYDIAQIVSFWQSEIASILSDVIGYADVEINRYGAQMHNMITDAWLYLYPTADISTTNTGGIRQSVPAGEISLATIVGVLPFENAIVEIELTGEQVENCIQHSPDLVIGGITTIGGFYHLDGTPIVTDSVYIVLTTDYLYSIDDYLFKQYDSTPYYTAIHYRQPVIDWIQSLQTSLSDPLNNYLDSDPRR